MNYVLLAYGQCKKPQLMSEVPIYSVATIALKDTLI